MKTYRQWLESADADNNRSFVIAERPDYVFNNTYSLVIGACHKTITLEFNAEKAQKRRSLAKLAKLEKALQLIREGLEA